ncbi:uncharacterized protein J8A68_004998 [[Candida] subhashii]|uniref:AB hydrolase-1 domain-containing protein n=1 Tax=[Candida] subhashii TaxID=561895 RepID=A0A8J5QNJ5_9ASCO|nr:uncharacterized protein J8A68_004998 [[Candida] subhashii]KAG7661420.1 hypothetical protein J8A68_004998 [[Candida] subhashii]
MVNYEIIDSFQTKGIVNQRVCFEVPLQYNNSKDSTTIKVAINITQKYDESLFQSGSAAALDKIVLPQNPKLIVYLQGGPGYPCQVPTSNSGKEKVLLERGYQIVFLDQRGTGLSTPIEGDSFEELVRKRYNDDYSVENQLEYILNFRADSIVEDLEVIRKELIPNQKWSLLGQSYGGFITFAYLSKYSQSLKEVLITGGIPPIGFSVDEIYQATYERTKERNVHYYNKFPQDKAKVAAICQYLSTTRVILPNEGILSVERFQQLGLIFGATGGTDRLHEIVTKFYYDLQFGQPTYQILNTIQNELGFDTNVIYALFQEAIYCDGNIESPTNWGANRLRNIEGNEKFIKNDHEVYFTGEMVYKSMFEDYSELRKFKNLADRLHQNTKWSRLYDVEHLKTVDWNKVPVVAATYFDDQYVDFGLSREAKKRAFNNNGNLKQYITSEHFHNGLRADPEKVLGALFTLLDNGDLD